MKIVIAFAVFIGLALTPARALPHLTIDLDSGRVLSQQQAFDPWHPASLTKLMTALVVFRALETGAVSADETVRVSRNAARQQPSKMHYAPGTLITVEDALKLLIVKSANDISVALAEHVSGSVEGFARKMNDEAARLGMTGSRFINPHGLHDQRQVTTARDMALLISVLHKNYPQYADWFAAPGVLAQARTKQGKIIERIHYSYNLLVERYRGADGFKTGFVCASGYNFIGSATRAGRRIAAIVLGRSSQTHRAVDAAKLITGGFELSTDAGTPLAELKPDGTPATRPANMRPRLCTPEARAARYEPGAGQAVIKSPWLDERTPRKITLRTRFATKPKGVPRRNVPLPRFRPTPIDDTVRATSAAPIQLPTPSFRPGTALN
ncbi:D-alanyl-D-alanine carboxypeptidase family protein [Pseudahrensia aquimaris]|uniref:D-alanyl-D-alanine carboxypeptidase family protein n=1 Tax=Pseudahrensia aquimaris TaxID=744461 RepID=A0ABW3F9L8_9HYPH